VAYVGVDADFLWPDFLPDANPTYSWCCFGVYMIKWFFCRLFFHNGYML
jgi:hypothetical protein